MNILIIGGGASGMVAALTAAKQHHNITILEQRDRIGRKILATGNGRCNLSNADQSLSHYHALAGDEAAETFVSEVFKAYDQKSVLEFFRSLGVEIRDRNGYLYPASEQASAVLDVLRFALENEKVRIVTDCKVKQIQKTGGAFLVKTDSGNYEADRLLLSAGSRAGIPSSASDGYALAKEIGHTILDPVPALVQLCSDEKDCKMLSGIRTQAKISLLEENHLIASESGEIQFTDYGFSGIPTLQISYLVSERTAKKQRMSVAFDLMQSLTLEECCDLLIMRRQESGYKTCEQFLIGLFHKNLGLCLMKRAGIALTKKVSALSDDELTKLAKLIKAFSFSVKGTRSFQDAQVCAGGVRLDEISKNMESKIIPGLYFAGEIIDIHADCGGYNLQFAFATGMLAGSHIGTSS